jgi:phenylalanine-4-hydroxylase
MKLVKENRMIINPETIELDADHPGFRDMEYRARREMIARASDQYKGTPETIPIIKYTDTENGVWRYVFEKLQSLNKDYACESHIEGIKALGIVTGDHIPQLKHISEIMIKKTGFQMAPVKGLVPGHEFIRSFAEGIFYSTQYIRHHSQPGFTPEPDIIHEILGHSGGLCDQVITRIAREIGNAALRTSDPERLAELGSIYWFTIEYGLVKEDNKIKTFGAGNLSSFIDLQRSVEDPSCHRPFEIEVIAKTPIDPTLTQDILFVANSFEDCYLQVKQFCDTIK